MKDIHLNHPLHQSKAKEQQQIFLSLFINLLIFIPFNSNTTNKLRLIPIPISVFFFFFFFFIKEITNKKKWSLIMNDDDWFNYRVPYRSLGFILLWQRLGVYLWFPGQFGLKHNLSQRKKRTDSAIPPIPKSQMKCYTCRFSQSSRGYVIRRLHVQALGHWSREYSLIAFLFSVFFLRGYSGAPYIKCTGTNPFLSCQWRRFIFLWTDSNPTFSRTCFVSFVQFAWSIFSSFL